MVTENGSEKTEVGLVNAAEATEANPEVGVALQRAKTARDKANASLKQLPVDDSQLRFLLFEQNQALLAAASLQQEQSPDPQRQIQELDRLTGEVEALTPLPETLEVMDYVRQRRTSTGEKSSLKSQLGVIAKDLTRSAVLLQPKKHWGNIPAGDVNKPYAGQERLVIIQESRMTAPGLQPLFFHPELLSRLWQFCQSSLLQKFGLRQGEMPWVVYRQPGNIDYILYQADLKLPAAPSEPAAPESYNQFSQKDYHLAESLEDATTAQDILKPKHGEKELDMESLARWVGRSILSPQEPNRREEPARKAGQRIHKFLMLWRMKNWRKPKRQARVCGVRWANYNRSWKKLPGPQTGMPPRPKESNNRNKP